MGGTKRKIRLDQKLEKKNAIKTTFTKRRKTLFKKSQKLCEALPQSQVSVAAIVFSPGGKPYVFGYPPGHPDSLFDSFLRASAPAPDTVRPPSSYSFAVGGGSGSGGTPFAQETYNNNKGTEKILYQDLEWLSLTDCDTLDKMIAKRDLLLRMGDVIQQSLLSSSSSSTITAATTSVGPEPLATVATTDHRLLTSSTTDEFEDHPQAGQGAESSSLDGGGWSTLIQGTTTGVGQVEDYDNPNVDYDMWDRLMIFNDDDAYLNIDSLLC